jgi:hypothetical protein
VGRTKDGSPFTKVGFAAEGLICGNSSCSSSIADGVYGYDSTSGTKGNNLKFVEKTPPDDPNPAGTISYPFPIPTVDAEYLKGLAENQPDGNKYLNLPTQSLNWDTLYPNARSDRVVFIDANGSDINFATGNQARNQGIFVVRCAGVLTMDQNFDGIIIVLKGQSPEHGSGCSDKARYKCNGVDIKGYVYAEGTSTSSPSIDLISNSVISPLLAGKEHLLGLSGLGSSKIKLVGWRELYQ